MLKKGVSFINSSSVVGCRSLGGLLSDPFLSSTLAATFQGRSRIRPRYAYTPLLILRTRVPRTRIHLHNPNRIHQFRKRLCKQRPKTPILQPQNMPLKDRIHHGLILLRRAQQTIHRIIRPIDAQPRSEGQEPIIERIILRICNQFIPQVRPGQVIYPRRMGDVDLICRRAEKFRQPFVVFLRGMDLPAHDAEHGEQGGDLVGQVGDVGEFGDDVGHELGEGVERGGGGGVEEGGDGGVGGGGGGGVGGGVLAGVEEVEEEAVEGAGWGAEFGKDAPCGLGVGGGRGVGGTAA